MKVFLQRHKDQILGVLSGFDRLRFRGSLKLLLLNGRDWLAKQLDAKDILPQRSA